MRAAALIIALGVMTASCANRSPNHIGNPLTLPGRAIINGIQNASYEVRRARVKAFALENRAQIYADIDASGGNALTQAMDLARVTPARRADLIAELRAHPEIYRREDIEPLIVAIMVHGE